MKGIYALSGIYPVELDFRAIREARAVFPHLEIAMLALPACSNDIPSSETYSSIISQIRGRLKTSKDGSAGVSFNFYQDCRLEEFLRKTSTAMVSVFKDGLFVSVREVPFESRLVVPSTLSEQYSTINFPKHFLNLDP